MALTPRRENKVFTCFSLPATEVPAAVGRSRRHGKVATMSKSITLLHTTGFGAALWRLPMSSFCRTEPSLITLISHHPWLPRGHEAQDTAGGRDEEPQGHHAPGPTHCLPAGGCNQNGGFLVTRLLPKCLAVLGWWAVAPRLLGMQQVICV